MKIQVTHLFEDTGFCKDVFQSVSEPRFYVNRDSESGEWYTATPVYYENDSRVRTDVVIEILEAGEVVALDGNGMFDGKRPFVPFHQFRESVIQMLMDRYPTLKGYEVMKEKLLSLPVGESHADSRRIWENWVYDLDSGRRREQITEKVRWLGREFHILAVQEIHRPTGFVFTNFRLRAADQPAGSASSDLLLYDWQEGPHPPL